MKLSSSADRHFPLPEIPGLVRPIGPRAGRPSPSVFRRRRFVAGLFVVTAITGPLLLTRQTTADAASQSAPEPVRAAATLTTLSVVRVQAGTPRITPAKPPAKSVTGQALLANPRLTVSDGARSDLLSATMDPRVLEMLAKALVAHRVEVTTIVSGHTKFVRGTDRVSNHVFGRAIDIASVDGRDVSADNEAARQLMDEVFAYPDAIRPTEVGGPWDLDGAEGAGFTDSGHRAHIHLGYDA